MRRNGWTLLGLALIAGPSAPPARVDAASTPEVESFGKGPAYKELSRLAVLHSGRVKPLDTLAREEVKQIYGREKISFLGPDGKAVATWEPVAAVLDWGARPDYWNDRPIIKVEYLPLKRAILAGAIKAELLEVAARPSVGPADKAALEKVAALDEVSADDLRPILDARTLPKADGQAVAELVAKLGESHKWLSAKELEAARIREGSRLVPFAEWIDAIGEKMREAELSGGQAKLGVVERRGYEVGSALARYRDLRDRGIGGFAPLMLTPRPFNKAYVAFSGEALAHQQEPEHGDHRPSMIELEAAFVLRKYLEDVPQKDWRMPGTDADFDLKYADWLRDNSSWVPLPVVLGAAPADLERAGYSVAKVEAFRNAFRGFEQAEQSSPGNADEAAADLLAAAARDLGSTLNPKVYPGEEAIGREVAFNAIGPFFYAPFAFGLATVLLALSLSVQSSRTPLIRSIHRGLYLGGFAAFLGGLGLEVIGFAFRVSISGWAPVTNMYETVIWVAMVTSILGLVLELINRRTFPILAASGVAATCTALAATVPMLDPSIHGLVPVLRSNLWLTIHVLTIVSSYAAFALGMGLGLIATGYYLTATYRRSASMAELAMPLLPGVPLLASGIVLMLGSYDSIALGRWAVDYAFYPSVGLVGFGGLLTAMSLVALLGELLNRAIFAPTRAEAVRRGPAPGKAGKSAEVRELVGAGGPIPPISGGSPLADEDYRTVAMRETAARIKSLSNFIYRAMQVGVLLVAAGTILGGVWADYSWGRFWGWDPKEVWALITLLVYLIPLHGRFAGWVNTFGLVMASVVCFLSVLMAWYGVNSVLGVGLHAYGFVEGGSQGTVGLFTLGVLSIPAGAAWRRYLSQH